MFDHVRLISFDLDDTLWPCLPTIQAAEKACYAWLATEAPRLTETYDGDALRAHRIAFARRNPDIAHDLTEVRLRSLAELLIDAGYNADLAKGASDVFRVARNRVEPYAEVIEALRILRVRYVLVSVTNGNSQIEQTPLHASFDFSLTAAEVGAAKPDPAIFHAASQRSGVGLDGFLHIGDDPLRDVQAARGIGVSAVWVNRSNIEWPTDVERADLEISDITELVDRLC